MAHSLQRGLRCGKSVNEQETRSEGKRERQEVRKVETIDLLALPLNRDERERVILKYL